MNGSFWKNAALLAAIITSCLGVFFTVILPLYSRDSPIKGVAQTEAASTDAQLRRSDYELCLQLNKVRINQRLVLEVLAQRGDIFKPRPGKEALLRQNTRRVLAAWGRVQADGDCAVP